jgi:hypothetical protein
MARELIPALKQLKRYGMASACEELLGARLRQAKDPVVWVQKLIEAERVDRQVRSLNDQLHVARFSIHCELDSSCVVREVSGFGFMTLVGVVPRGGLVPRISATKIPPSLYSCYCLWRVSLGRESGVSDGNGHGGLLCGGLSVQGRTQGGSGRAPFTCRSRTSRSP